MHLSKDAPREAMPYFCAFIRIFCGQGFRRSFVFLSFAAKRGLVSERSASVTSKREYFLDESTDVGLSLDQLVDFLIELSTDNVETVVLATIHKCADFIGNPTDSLTNRLVSFLTDLLYSIQF